MLISLFRAIDDLIGQANSEYAKQNIEEALDYLREAIRQDPRHPDPYFQISKIYEDQKIHSVAFEF
jgi:tetratricopeptide (TPR) repeat protein